MQCIMYPYPWNYCTIFISSFFSRKILNSRRIFIHFLNTFITDIFCQGFWAICYTKNATKFVEKGPYGTELNYLFLFLQRNKLKYKVVEVEINKNWLHRKHQRADHHDRREGERPDQGGLGLLLQQLREGQILQPLWDKGAVSWDFQNMSFGLEN